MKLESVLIPWRSTNHYLSVSQALDIFQLTSSIQERCQPFLEAIGGFKNIDKYVLYRGKDKIFRGTTGYPNSFVKTIRSNRQPKDILPKIHEQLDEMFLTTFGWRMRSNSIFCTGNLNQARLYGADHCVLPIGNFRFLWSPTIIDLFKTVRGIEVTLAQKYSKNPKIPSNLKEYHKELNERMQQVVDSYTDTNLIRAIQSGHEIAIHSDKYFLVSLENPHS